MPFISIRALTRETKDIFEKLENEGEPFVITHHGKPVATLTPIADSEVEASVLAAAPGFIRSRQEAELARAEGRTEPVDTVLRRLGLAEGVQADAPVSVDLDELTDRMAQLFGAPVAGEMSEQVSARVEDISRSVEEEIASVASPQASLEATATEQIRMINARFFVRVLENVLDETTASIAARLGGGAVKGQLLVENPESEDAEIVFGKRIALDALARASYEVYEVNRQIVKAGKDTGGLSLLSYETAVRSLDELHVVGLPLRFEPRAKAYFTKSDS